MSKHSKQETEGSFIKNLIIDILIAALIAGAVLFFIRPTIVKQSSMENTFIENDYLIMYKRAYKSAEPQRGDIIIFQSDLPSEDGGDDKLLIKRIIGLPGDTISIKDNQLYVNGEAYQEDYIKDGITPAAENPVEGETLLVPAGKYYAMGDNRVVSIDSRYNEVGCISRDTIQGKIVLRLFPFNKIGRF